MPATTARTPIQVSLSPAERDLLSALAEHENTSRAHVVRTLIRNAHAFEFGGEPRCANSQHCLCPQLWQRRQANQ